MDRINLIVAAVLAAFPSLAQVPNYDTARHCTEFAKGSPPTENQCRRDEADARRELEKIRVSQEVCSYLLFAIRPEQSYVLLYGCTLNEAEAGANQSVGSTNAPTSNSVAEPATKLPALLGR
jgi:hypothetical protein